MSAHTVKVLAGARCAETDLDLFFPAKGGSPRAALKICSRCEVREHCLQKAVA